MIKCTVGNILSDHADVLVNTVNTEGVMGKGIALAFKKAFPGNFKHYEQVVKEGHASVGKVILFRTGLTHPKYIVNFPTKKHWRHPSKMEYVEAGLQDLVEQLEAITDARSIALPPLGCGNGKLNWAEVKPVMLRYLEPLSTRWAITIYEPGLQDQRMVERKEVPLTAARAILLHLLDRYRILGYDINLLVAQKMTYLMQRFGEPMKLEFVRGPYGPYAHNLNFLLQKLNGAYLWYKEEDNKPTTTVKLEADKLAEVERFIQEQASDEQRQRMDQVLDLIQGLETPYGLELLSTVDFVMHQTGKRDVAEIQEEIHNWTDRKKELMKPQHIQLVHRRLMQHLSHSA
jgi:O-acetyl-ADP-ribose deacetylase (regulator of RNase III)